MMPDKTPYAEELVRAIKTFHRAMTALNLEVRISELAMSPMAEVAVKRSLLVCREDCHTIAGVPFKLEGDGVQPPMTDEQLDRVAYDIAIAASVVDNRHQAALISKRDIVNLCKRYKRS